MNLVFSTRPRQCIGKKTGFKSSYFGLDASLFSQSVRVLLVLHKHTPRNCFSFRSLVSLRAAIHEIDSVI